jgi:hypothetical protein
MANNPNLKEAQSKGGKVTGPQKNGYFREQLEKHVFKSDKVFGEWVKDNYTDAVKELGKLQPRNMTVAGDPDGAPIKMQIERLIVDKTTDTNS